MTIDQLRALRYSDDHCWARKDDDGSFTIGLTDFAQSALGAIVFANVPVVGTVVEANGVLGEVESTKAVSEIYAPFAGRVTAANATVAEHPGQLNDDPYGAGSICSIEADDASTFDQLLDADAYAAFINIAPEPGD